MQSLDEFLDTVAKLRDECQERWNQTSNAEFMAAWWLLQSILRMFDRD